MNSKTLLRILLIASVVFTTACDHLKWEWEYLVDNPLETDIRHQDR